MQFKVHEGSGAIVYGVKNVTLTIEEKKHELR